MKKTAIAAALMIASTASHGATLTAGETFNINILADGVSCFTFGACNAATGAMVDNNSDAMANSANTGTFVGSAVAGDGLAGFMNVTTAADGSGGVTFSVNSFNMDTYLGTAGGAFATMAADTSGMSGSVDAAGNITFDPTGRTGIAQFFGAPTSLGEQPWNEGATFTSGNQVNAVADYTGSALALDGSATVVSVTEVANWGFFVGTPYTEVFSLDFSNATVVASPSAVPVPAAVWLFGSGLVGLAGVARRRKSA